MNFKMSNKTKFTFYLPVYVIVITHTIGSVSLLRVKVFLTKLLVNLISKRFSRSIVIISILSVDF